MNAALELVSRALGALPAGQIPLPWIGAVGLAGLLLLVLVARAALGSRAGGDTLHQRVARARSLARRGASRGEIARATGLSRDAVAMLLSAPEVGRVRRILPGAARISRPAARPTPGEGARGSAVTSVAA